MGSFLFCRGQSSAQMKIESLCPSFMTYKFKLAEFYAVGSKKFRSRNVPFFHKKGTLHEGNCTCNTLPPHVHYCVPTLTLTNTANGITNLRSFPRIPSLAPVLHTSTIIIIYNNLLTYIAPFNIRMIKGALQSEKN